MTFSYALSISHFVSSVGADAGFAALVGLAILVLLYFAHAREAATLRKELEATTQRLEALERRGPGAPGAPVAPRPPVSAPASTAQAASQRDASSAAQVTGPATVTAGAATHPGVAPRPASLSPVAAPAGVAAPALTDATRVVPSSEQLAQDRAAASADGKTPAPATAAGGGNGSSAGELPASRSLLEYGLPGRTPAARWLLPLLAVVIAAAIAVALVVVLSGGRSHAVVHRSGAHIAAAPAGVAPGAVTVAVVNATSVNQLAHHVGSSLTSKGFREGMLASASNQSLTTTTVNYLPGHRKDALAVAHALRLPASAVRNASSNVVGLVCPAGAACAADVIVVAGSDLAPTR